MGVPNRSALALATAAALAGCVSAGPVRTSETVLPGRFEAAGGTLAPQALDRWWLLFNDPQLTLLVESALERGTDVRAAAARLREARAIRRGALTGFNPQGDLNVRGQAQGTEILSGGEGGFTLPGGTPGQPGQSGGDNSFAQEGVAYSANLGFDVSWELDLFGRRNAARREADATLAAERFAYEAARASLASTVADTLFAIRGLALQAEEARETRRIQQQLRDVARVRAQRGLGAATDVARIDADLARADAEVARLEAELQASRRALLVLTGDAGAPTASLQLGPLLVALPATPSALPSEVLARRPDVREAQARLAAASGQLRTDELAFFPRLTLNPGVGLSTSSGGFFDATTAIWTLAAGLTAPILDRPRLISQLRVQEARVEAAVVAYERAVQTAFSEADQGLVRLAADRRQVDLLRAGQREAQRAFDGARTLYERGLTDLTTLLDAERTFRAARSATITAEVQALRRAVQVFNALGGGWNPSAPASESRG